MGALANDRFPRTPLTRFPNGTRKRRGRAPAPSLVRVHPRKPGICATLEIPETDTGLRAGSGCPFPPPTVWSLMNSARAFSVSWSAPEGLGRSPTSRADALLAGGLHGPVFAPGKREIPIGGGHRKGVVQFYVARYNTVIGMFPGEAATRRVLDYARGVPCIFSANASGKERGYAAKRQTHVGMAGRLTASHAAGDAGGRRGGDSKDAEPIPERLRRSHAKSWAEGGTALRGI